jgi:Right handed beta helix region
MLKSMLVVLVAAWCAVATAEAATYYALPSGGGSTCSSTAPCTLPTAIGKAISGDTVVAKNGTYYGSFVTRAGGVTIKAENKWGATLRNNNDERIFALDHSNVKLRGFRIDGQKLGSKGGAVMVHNRVSNVVIEHNRIFNTGAAAIGVDGLSKVSGVAVRHNLIEDTGWGGPGEGIYVGSHTGTADDVVGLQVYGNTLRRFTSGGIDLKPNTALADVHHNIFESQLYRPNPHKPGLEPTIVARRRGHRIHDNIIRNGSADLLPSVFSVSATQDIQIYENVVKNIPNNSRAIATRDEGPGGTASRVYNNTFGLMKSYSVQALYGLQVFGNVMNASSAACDAEIMRIVDEMKSLPGFAY